MNPENSMHSSHLIRLYLLRDKSLSNLGRVERETQLYIDNSSAEIAICPYAQKCCKSRSGVTSIDKKLTMPNDYVRCCSGPEILYRSPSQTWKPACARVLKMHTNEPWMHNMRAAYPTHWQFKDKTSRKRSRSLGMITSGWSSVDQKERVEGKRVQVWPQWLKWEKMRIEVKEAWGDGCYCGR